MPPPPDRIQPLESRAVNPVAHAPRAPEAPASPRPAAAASTPAVTVTVSSSAAPELGTYTRHGVLESRVRPAGEGTAVAASAAPPRDRVALEAVASAQVPPSPAANGPDPLRTPRAEGVTAATSEVTENAADVRRWIVQGPPGAASAGSASEHGSSPVGSAAPATADVQRELTRRLDAQAARRRARG